LLVQIAFQDRIVQRREAEFNHLKKERDERISQLISSRKHERETVRKLMHYLNMEEQRLDKLREEEEARKHEGKLILASLCTCALFYSQHGA
jgi:translation initiation factor 3 subunit A